MKNFAVIYLVDITEVPDFNKMYELYDPCTVMFFFRYVMVLECNSVEFLVCQMQHLSRSFLKVYQHADADIFSSTKE